MSSLFRSSFTFLGWYRSDRLSSDEPVRCGADGASGGMDAAQGVSVEGPGVPASCVLGPPARTGSRPTGVPRQRSTCLVRPRRVSVRLTCRRRRGTKDGMKEGRGLPATASPSGSRRRVCGVGQLVIEKGPAPGPGQDGRATGRGSETSSPIPVGQGAVRP